MWPVRNPDSTTFVGAIESSELFGLRIYQEAVRRGSERAHKIVFLIDGARYNKSIASTQFPVAVHIIDLYHARENLAAWPKPSVSTTLSSALGATFWTWVESRTSSIRQTPISMPFRSATLKAIYCAKT